MVDQLEHLYTGVPLWVEWLFWLALLVVVSSLISLVILTVRAQLMWSIQQDRRQKRKRPADATESEYLWVFMVPALNEEEVIADSVGRLAEVEVTHKRILVVNDGSTDRTAEILDSLEVPELTVLSRVAPNAREGKSEALNDAWRYIHREILARGVYKGWDPAKVIAVIVDADGRLDPHAGRVALHFDDDRVGGVQAQVHIYNRGTFLTLAQDIEFAVFGTVYQLGRMGWGTANMGGNGQFNRLKALDQVVVQDSKGREGPWAEGRLTEDQDVGLRLIREGWRGAQSSTVGIDQQGVKSLRLLYRQRTRWAQGSWQVLDLVWSLMNNRHVSLIARWDQFWYLMSPLIQAYIGLVLVLTIGFAVAGVTNPDITWTVVILLYALSALPGIFGVLSAHRKRGLWGVVVSILLAHLYLIYSWLIFPVVYRSLLRHLFGRRTWSKTARESISAEEAATE